MPRAAKKPEQETALPAVPASSPPAGWVEVLTLRPTWQGGEPVPAGTALLLPVSEAIYAESIGRVCRVSEP